jgi:hypothetical protein
MNLGSHTRPPRLRTRSWSWGDKPTTGCLLPLADPGAGFDNRRIRVAIQVEHIAFELWRNM